MNKEVLINCRDCGGTGIYKTEEMNGHCSLCLRCIGTGAEKISFTEFKGKISTTGVLTVTARKKYGESPVGGTVTYEEFAKGIMPESPY